MQISTCISTNWPRLHLKIFPNYLKTFNYKLSMDILPLKTKFVEYALDTDSKCNFCNHHAEASHHLFSQCAVLKFLWESLDHSMEIMGFQFRFTKAKQFSNIDLRRSKISSSEIRQVVYLNSISNLKIWNLSQKIQNEGLMVFCVILYFKKIIKNILIFQKYILREFKS